MFSPVHTHDTDTKQMHFIVKNDNGNNIILYVPIVLVDEDQMLLVSLTYGVVGV